MPVCPEDGCFPQILPVLVVLRVSPDLACSTVFLHSITHSLRLLLFIPRLDVFQVKDLFLSYFFLPREESFQTAQM